jgi:hypothetical protein
VNPMRRNCRLLQHNRPEADIRACAVEEDYVCANLAT